MCITKMDQSLFITSTHSCLTTSRATALAIAGGYDIRSTFIEVYNTEVICALFFNLVSHYQQGGISICGEVTKVFELWGWYSKGSRWGQTVCFRSDNFIVPQWFLQLLKADRMEQYFYINSSHLLQHETRCVWHITGDWEKPQRFTSGWSKKIPGKTHQNRKEKRYVRY